MGEAYTHFIGLVSEPDEYPLQTARVFQPCNLGLVHVVSEVRAAAARAGAPIHTAIEAGLVGEGIHVDNLANRYNSFAGCILGFSVITSTYNKSKRQVAEIRKLAPDVPIILGGVHPSVFPYDCLQRTQADIVVRGEADLVAPRLVALLREFGRDKLLKENSPLADIPGVCFRHARGTYISQSYCAPPTAEQLEEMVVPDLSQVRGFGTTYLPRGIPIQIGRGCFFECRFCSVPPLFGRKMRLRSPQQVVRLLTHQREMWRGVCGRDPRDIGLEIIDDLPIGDRKHAIETFHAVADAGFIYGVAMQTRCDSFYHYDRSGEKRLDVELVEALKRLASGTNSKGEPCHLITAMGIESLNTGFLDEQKKAQDVGVVKHRLRELTGFGLKPHALLIADGRKDASGKYSHVSSRNWLSRELGIKSTVSIMTPYPETPQFVEDYLAGRLKAKPPGDISDDRVWTDYRAGTLVLDMDWDKFNAQNNLYDAPPKTTEIDYRAFERLVETAKMGHMTEYHRQHSALKEPVARTPRGSVAS
jgi:hypothetical protein